VSALPAIDLAGGADREADRDSVRGALNGAPTAARGSKSEEIADQMLATARDAATAKRSRNHLVSPVISPKTKERAKGLEPSTSSLGS